MKKRITGLFAAALLALSIMAVPAMAVAPDAPGSCEEVVELVNSRTGFDRDPDAYCNY